MNTTKTPSPTTTASNTVTAGSKTNQPKEVKRLGYSQVQDNTSQVIGTVAQTMAVVHLRRDATPQAAAQAAPTTTTPGSKVFIKDSSFKRADITNSTVHNFTGTDFRLADAVTIDTSAYEGATISKGSKVSNFGGARF